MSNTLVFRNGRTACIAILACLAFALIPTPAAKTSSVELATGKSFVVVLAGSTVTNTGTAPRS